MNHATATIGDFLKQTQEEQDASPLFAAIKDAPLGALATPADDRPTLVASPVVTEADALIMGAIRHIQRHGFSADNSEIDDDRQRRWWAAHRNRVKAWLYTFDGNLVGFGALLQSGDGSWVSSCAVLPGHEGRKFGGRILSHLIQSVDHEVYARALISNPAACALHNDREWEMTGEDEQCRYYRTRPKVRVEHSLSAYDYAQPEAELPCGWFWGEQR
jgi:GNAT superfamily N-acetyltransferase